MEKKQRQKPQQQQNCPHDRYLKSVLEDPKIAADFFNHHLPAKVRKAVDLSTLKAQKESYLDPKLDMGITDVLFSADFKGQPGYLYVLLEHTSTPDKMLPFRMLNYSVAIMRHHLKINSKNKILPIVYPLMFFTGTRPFKHSMNIYDAFGAHKRLAQEIYNRPYTLVDITQITDEQMQMYEWFTFAGYAMKYVRAVDYLLENDYVVDCVVELKEKGENQYILQTFNYLTKAGHTEMPERLLADFHKGLANKGENIMTLEEHLINKGIERGIERGIETGIERGIDQGLARGEERLTQTALNLLEMGMDADTVSKATELPLEKVSTLSQKAC